MTDRIDAGDNFVGSFGSAQPLTETNLLLNLYRTLIESSELRAGMGSVLGIVRKFADWDLGLAWLVSEDQQKLEFLVASHENDGQIAEFAQTCARQSFALGTGVTGRVWQTAKPEWIKSLADQPPDLFPLALPASKAKINATLAVPVTQNDRVLGILVFCTRGVNQEDDRVVQIVSRVATQLGFALRHTQVEESLRRQEALLQRSREELELRVSQRTVQLTITNEALQAEIFARKRLQEEMLSRVDQQETVVYIGQRALSGLELPQLLQEACERLAKTLGVEFCKVLELEPDGQHLVLRAGVGWREGLVGQAIVAAGSGSQAGYTLTSKAPVMVDELRAETRFRGSSLLMDHGVVSGVSVIIPGRGKPFGLLGAHAKTRRSFRGEDIKFLESIAHILSQAIARRDEESAIQRGEGWLRSLIEATQDAVLSIDRRGCIVLFNPSAERIFGYARSEVVGRKVNMLMAEPYASEHDGYIENYERTGEARAIGRIRSVTAKRKSGELFPIELSVTKIAEDQNVHYAAFIRDTSEKAKLQAQLVENERLVAIGTTTAKIGHELANPLNGMSLTIQLLEQRLAKQADVLDVQIVPIVNRLKSEVSRLSALLEQFRSLSRREKFDFQRITPANLVGEAIELELPRYAEMGIHVDFSLAQALPAITVDIDKMKQVILNLAKNAMEAMPAGGRISLTGFVSGDNLILEISDTGSGIPSDVDVFEPFFTTKPKGTGIGLAIVRQIVRAHGGSVDYRSRVGEGTTFVVTLPLN